ncbi:hypothetical protein EVAR_103937_1 [Eumeta japonica]|uniref:Uncharacterized protein n=1 Tax=Eumeta variegata TaxID=151549 RepID=A0A4C1YC48_EUMVA|nr:hypothetical protein EVAR_103937_1 [Eumeta japonica]
MFLPKDSGNILSESEHAEAKPVSLRSLIIRSSSSIVLQTDGLPKRVGSPVRLVTRFVQPHGVSSSPDRYRPQVRAGRSLIGDSYSNVRRPLVSDVPDHRRPSRGPRPFFPSRLSSA